MTRDTVTIEKVVCASETFAAIRVLINGESKWIPKSVIHDDSEVYKPGTDGDLVIARWFAEKEGIEP